MIAFYTLAICLLALINPTTAQSGDNSETGTASFSQGGSSTLPTSEKDGVGSAGNSAEAESIYNNENLLPVLRATTSAKETPQTGSIIVEPQQGGADEDDDDRVVGDFGKAQQATTKLVVEATTTANEVASESLSAECEADRQGYFPRHLYTDCVCDTGDKIDCYNSIGSHRFTLPTNSSVRILRLHKAELASINNETFDTPSVTMIIATLCGLSEIGPNSFRSLKNLQVLDLSLNKLTVLPGSVFNTGDDPTVESSLRLLNLSNNQLSVLDPSIFASLVSLSDIDLSNNKLSVITQRFPHLPHLRTIRLGYNFFRTFTADFYLNAAVLPSLELVSAERCDISVLQIGLFADKPLVISFDAGSNTTTPLNTAAVRRKTLKFDLAMNPRLQCTCDLYMLQHYYGSSVSGNCQDTRFAIQQSVPLLVPIAKLNVTQVCSTAGDNQNGIDVNHDSAQTLGRSSKLPPYLHEHWTHTILLPFDVIPIAVAGMLVTAIFLSILFSAVVVCSHRNYEQRQQQQQQNQQQLSEEHLQHGKPLQRTAIEANRQIYYCPQPSFDAAVNEEVFYSADLSQTVILIRTAKKPMIDQAQVAVAPVHQPTNNAITVSNNDSVSNKVPLPACDNFEETTYMSPECQVVTLVNKSNLPHAVASQGHALVVNNDQQSQQPANVEMNYTSQQNFSKANVPTSWTRNIQERLSKILSGSKAVVVYNTASDTLDIRATDAKNNEQRHIVAAVDKSIMHVTASSNAAPNTGRKLRMQILV